jgi:hypothetical protein
MTSSGTYNYTLSYGEAVLAAYARCKVRLPELRQEHLIDARRELNLLLSEWSNKQVNLWKVALNSVPLVQGIPTYTLPANVVLVLDAYRTINNGASNQVDIYISSISRTTYDAYASKFTQGPPISYWFDRLIVPTVTLWPVPDAGGPYTLNYHCVTQIQDADVTSGQTPDIPYRWLDALVAGLAKRLGRIYADPSLQPTLDSDALGAWSIAAQQDIETVNVKLLPQLGQYYRQ